MVEKHLATDEFLSRLADLLSSQQGSSHGSIFLVQKRLSYGQAPFVGANSGLENGSGDQFVDLDPSAPLPLLLRATNGSSRDKIESKIKLSTIVQPTDLEEFFLRYAEVCKYGMQGLKKRDRSGRKKAKAKKRKEADGEKKS